MHSHILRTIATGVALTLLLFSCRQPIDLDTDRTVVPTNLPEITDFSPKASNWSAKITINGKNFVNVQRVMLDTLVLDSVVVESPSRIQAVIPMPQFGQPPYGVLYLSITTGRGTTKASEGFVRAWGTASGKITLDKQPLDSTILYLSKPLSNLTAIILTNALSATKTFGTPKGWFVLNGYGIDLGGDDSKEIVLHPFKSGYSFAPGERRFLKDPDIIGGQDFEATLLPPERLPSVTSITPGVGASYGWSETGTTIVLSGTGFNKVKKAVIVTPYPSLELANPYSTTLGYKEAKAITIENDNKISIAIPRLDGTKAIPGRTYNCQVYLLTDEGSIVAPQRVNITYL